MTCASAGFKKTLESIGTVVTATRSEIATLVMTVSAKGPKMSPCRPGISSSGTKTVTTVIVDERTALKICVVAFRAASSGESPSSRCRKMFSVTTTASSTINPTDSAIPPSVIVLSVWCVM